MKKRKRIYLILKRTIDIILSCIGIMILWPIFLIIALCIKIEDSKGPVFFIQERVGEKGRRFKMWKFRSMLVNAEELLEKLEEQNEVKGYMFKIKKDPRITKVGKFIRKTSMDELPQLFNVIKGEMSLVGPRPPLPREVARYSEYHIKRLEVKPGLTGYWQVSGRSNLSFEEMVELDLKYIRERSLIIDTKIIFKTIFVLFHRDGAY